MDELIKEIQKELKAVSDKLDTIIDALSVEVTAEDIEHMLDPDTPEEPGE